MDPMRGNGGRPRVERALDIYLSQKYGLAYLILFACLFGTVLAAPAVGIYFSLAALGVPTNVAASGGWMWVVGAVVGLVVWRWSRVGLLFHLIQEHGLAASLATPMPRHSHLARAHRALHVNPHPFGVGRLPDQIISTLAAG